MSQGLECNKCHAPLGPELFNRLELAPCPRCAALLQIDVFPAFFRTLGPGAGAQTILVEGEASCFYHPQKRAVLPCQGCGRFLCGLCDCELHGEHYCPACLETGRNKGKIKRLENRRTLYDSIALALAIFPILFIYATVLTAPMTIYVAIRYWNAPLSIVHRSRVRYIIAIVIAVLQILGWAGLGYWFWGRRSHG
jgi:hypothetical protein